ncbi:MAG TPA: GGDEF domain-containing protein [Chloroflexota bacterium]|nr:GGDEF domain-containing protein [Chloroflexota bacterium]
MAAAPRVTGPALAVLLQNNTPELVNDWARVLKSGAFGGYADVPIDELESSIKQCLAAFIATLRSGDHGRMRRFGHREVRRRLAQGYHESEIDQLVCACRIAASPFIVREYADCATDAVAALNLLQHCIDQAQFEMSDFYQALAQQRAEEHLAEMEAMFRQLEEISVRDALTGLYNRRYFQDRLEQEFQRGERHHRPVSLIMVDIDHFKRVNDTYGHPVGDEVLKAVAQLLLDQTRTIDIAGRYGGEEFALLLPETALADAQHVAERLRERVAATALHRIKKEGLAEQALRCTVSLGLASYAGVGYASPAAFLSAADTALYAAKHAGRNRVETAPTTPAA